MANAFAPAGATRARSPHTTGSLRSPVATLPRPVGAIALHLSQSFDTPPLAATQDEAALIDKNFPPPYVPFLFFSKVCVMTPLQAAEREAEERDRSALAGIVAALFAILGLSAGARIPYEVRRRILRVLRPAESAVRRLIVVLARGMKEKAAPPRPAPVGLVRAKAPNRPLRFQLFDRRRRFSSAPPRPMAPVVAPRIRLFEDGSTGPIFSFAASTEKPAEEAASESDGLIASTNLLRRLEAIRDALADLPRQAKRLARATARRAKSERLKAQMPLRPGAAPGYRRRPSHEVDHILERFQWRARRALDTS